VIAPAADWPQITFAQLRSILVNKLHCRIDPPPKNLVYKPASKPLVIVVRTSDNGDEFEWPAYHADDDLLSRGIVLNACRCLHIMLEALDLRAHLRTP
jgi:hypothetical protein